MPRLTKDKFAKKLEADSMASTHAAIPQPIVSDW